MIAAGTIAAIHLGSVEPIGSRGQLTAYRKTPAAGAIRVHALGLEGDHQVNKRFHGGPEKAIYGYPLAGYAAWRAEFPAIADRFAPGAMGENLVVTGQDEESMHIGDIIRCGTALLQISQIREPCNTFAAIIGTTRVVRAMVKSGRCGWYYRVLEPGIMCAVDGHTVIDRPNPAWPVCRLATFAAGRAGTIEALHELATLPGLSRDWQIRAATALAAQARPP
jgi:MOSC domain-containing protein YiiM